MKKIILGSSALAAVLLSSSATAAVITFDEFAADDANGAIPAARYSSLGVTFVGTDDGSTWGGNSNGNPGNWGIEGTNGAIFSGFNGSSYSQTLTFDSIIGSFALDASRSNGSTDGTIFLEGYLGANLIASTSAALGAINDWSTLSIACNFDRVVYFGTGTGFSPFGVDNLQFDAGAVPEPATWAFMILGFGAIGGAMRRQRKASVKVSYA